MGCAHNCTADGPEPGLSLLRLCLAQHAGHRGGSRVTECTHSRGRGREELRVSESRVPLVMLQGPCLTSSGAFQTQYLY